MKYKFKIGQIVSDRGNGINNNITAMIIGRYKEDGSNYYMANIYNGEGVDSTPTILSETQDLKIDEK